MKQKIGLFLCLALLLTGCSYQTKTIRFGAADIGGMYYTVANAYAGLASKESSDLKFEVKNTAGSAANLRLLSGNYIDLGIAQADLVRAAHEGTGSFSDNRQQGYRAIAGLYTEACQIVVRADSDIRTLNDLQGKTVSIGASESGTEQNATEILKLSGLTSKLVHMVNLDYADAAGKLVKLTPYSAPPASALLSSKNWQRNVICGFFPSTIPVWKNCLQPQKNTANMSFLQTLTVDRTKT